MAKRKKPTPTVKRGAGGKIESLRKPIAPLAGDEVKPKPDQRYAAPVRTKVRKQTRTGKPIDKATGKIAEGVSPVTVLPTADRDKVEGAEPIRGRAKGGTRVVKGDAPVVPVKGFAVAYPKVHAAVQAARTHLGVMELNHPSSPEHHAAHEAFNAIHANIGKMSPELHTLLGQAKHFVTHPGKGTKELLGMTHKAIDNRLALGRMAANANLTRSAEGREGK